MTSHIGHNFIAGKRSAAGTATLQSFAAATGAPLAHAFFQATPQEVDAAARGAERAYHAYRHTTPTERALFLDAIADEIDGLDEGFIATVCLETGLPHARIVGERLRTSGQMRMFAGMLRRGDFFGARIDRALPNRAPSPRPDLRQYRLGIGPVAIFGASNFPLAFSTAGGDTASALAAGCPVVFKAHSGHMATADFVARALIRAAERSGMPAGVFNMIYGSGVGAALVRHPAIHAVGFTGSLEGGRALCDMAAARREPIPVFAEMSSINPVILLPEALKASAAHHASELVKSATLGGGQFCTKPGLAIGIRSAEFTRFTEGMIEAMREQAAQTMLNAGTLESYRSNSERMASHPQVRHLGGRAHSTTQAEPQLFMASAAMLIEGDPILQEEIFGPCVVVVEVAGQDELLVALGALRGQLTATLIAEESDLDRFAALVPLLERKAGRLLVNGYPTGVEVSDAMVHGGPYPATSDARGTSVGTLAIDRFLRPVCYQNYPDRLLPAALKDANPLGILRLVDGEMTRAALEQR